MSETEDLFFSGNASYVTKQGVQNYFPKCPYDPPEAYPELPFVGKIEKENEIYSIVRDLLGSLHLDKKNFSTRLWNPFENFIKPGFKVLIKPNLVTSKHQLGKNAIFSTIVHGSVIRPIIDYVSLALQGNGEIIIADNPIEHADFEAITRINGISEMVDSLNARNHYPTLSVLDLRPKVLKEADNGEFYYESQIGDPLGYTSIDLGKESLFSEFDNKPGIHFYTLADRTIDHFDPRWNGESITDRYHNSKTHKYVVSKSVLDADVVINIAKLKTHCKAGVTLSLKNIIGMVYLKDCMPHHRPGIPPEGDSFPHFPAYHYTASKKLYRSFRKYFHIHRYSWFKSIRKYMSVKKILIDKHIEHGNWKGNDTVWRTILDLNRIALYADKDGRMREKPQRSFFYIIDGIIGQQGDGPLNGEPVTSSTIFGGFNPVFVDALAVKAMGIDPMSIKTISNASKIEKWKLCSNENTGALVPKAEVPNFDYRLPHGWT